MHHVWDHRFSFSCWYIFSLPSKRVTYPVLEIYPPKLIHHKNITRTKTNIIFTQVHAHPWPFQKGRAGGGQVGMTLWPFPMERPRDGEQWPKGRVRGRQAMTTSWTFPNEKASRHRQWFCVVWSMNKLRLNWSSDWSMNKLHVILIFRRNPSNNTHTQRLYR